MKNKKFKEFKDMIKKISKNLRKNDKSLSNFTKDPFEAMELKDIENLKKIINIRKESIN